MEKYFKLLLPLLLFLLTACQEGGDAGDLQGMWRLSGSTDKHVSFSGSIAQFRQLDKGEVFANFQHTGDSLLIQCHSIEGLPSDTVIVESAFGFQPFSNIRLKIESLDNDGLILSHGSQRWTFEKW